MAILQSNSSANQEVILEIRFIGAYVASKIKRTTIHAFIIVTVTQ